MAEARPVEPVLLVVALFSRHDRALDWARQRLEQAYGPIGLASIPFLFDQTSYYERTMGTDLSKQFLAFQNLIDPGTLADIKLTTNDLERELAQVREFPDTRPLNLDPGYLTQGKFILASMKDHSHRIYLSKGVYAEVTLFYRGGRFELWPWTYRDYQLAQVHSFLEGARAYYRDRLAEPGPA